MEHESNMPPFSFFNFLVVNSSQFDSQRFSQIIAHEKVHICQWHTIDILFTEIASILLWANPLIWISKRYIKLNLEYIADEAVLNTGVNKKAYQYSLLYTSLNPEKCRLANLFNSSPIKLRIKMMNSKKSSWIGLYKYTLVIPLTIAVYFIIHPLNAQTAVGIASENATGSGTNVDGGIADAVGTTSNGNNIYLVIKPTIKEETLKKSR